MIKSIFLLVLLSLATSSYLGAQAASKVINISPLVMDDADDDTDYFQNLINNAPSGSIIKLPAGILTLSEKINLSKFSFSIVGVDAACTKIHFRGIDNGFDITGVSAVGGEFYMADIALVTFSPEGGIALHLYDSPPALRMSRVDVISRGNGYWNKSVRVVGERNGHVRVSDSYFSGVNNRSEGTRQHFEIKTAGDFANGNKIRLTRNHIKGADIGILVPSGISEGQFMVDNIFEDVRIAGLRTTSQPTFNWHGNRILAQETGLYLDGARDSIIDGNYIDVSNANGSAIALLNTQLRFVKVHGNYMTANKNGLLIPSSTAGIELVSLVSCYIKNAEVGFFGNARNISKSRIGGNVYDNVLMETSFPKTGDVKNFKTATEKF